MCAFVCSFVCAAGRSFDYLCICAIGGVAVVGMCLIACRFVHMHVCLLGYGFVMFVVRLMMCVFDCCCCLFVCAVVCLFVISLVCACF